MDQPRDPLHFLLGSDEEAADLRQRVKALACSPETRALAQRWSSKATEASNAANAVDFLTKAKALGVPARCWFVNESRHGGSLILGLVGRVHCQKALDALLGAGASIWPAHIANDQASFARADDVAFSIFPLSGSPVGAGNRARALKAALAGLGDLPADMVDAFFVALGRRFALAMAAGSATSSGSLGAGDKNAKICAKTALDCRSGLLQACRLLAPSRLEGMESLLATAENVLAAKSRQAREGFDPAKLKKELTQERKERLRTLCSLAEHCGNDGDALAAVLEATPWLAQSPQALCINIKSSASFAQCAFKNACPQGAWALDRLGANIWLASAQASEGNAVLWVCQMLRPGYGDEARNKRLDQMPPVAARLLAYGAFLDGAEDPIAHALAKLEQARQVVGAQYHSEIDAKTLTRLHSEIESLALADLLRGRSDSQSSGSRRRGAL